jgi:formate dehydrogenase maturation protein FdhE
MSTNDTEFALVGYCPICGQGRQFIARERETGSYYVMCEDCESEWDSPVGCDDIDTARQESHGRSDFVSLAFFADHHWREYVKNWRE